MAVEEAIDRLAAAVEQLAGGLETAVKVLASARSASAGRAAKSVATPPSESLETPPSAPALPYSEVQAAILKHSELRGAPATFALLEKLGVKSGKQLKPEQYGEAVKMFHVEPELA